MSECIECGCDLKGRWSAPHPEYSGDKLCDECAPDIYYEQVEEALVNYSDLMNEIIRSKN